MYKFINNQSDEYTFERVLNQVHVLITAIAFTVIISHLVLRFGMRFGEHVYEPPLLIALIIGGLAMLFEVGRQVITRDLGADVLAAISVVTAILLDEYLAGAIIVLMYSGGAALESYAVTQASSVLRALSKRMPSVAHRKHDTKIEDVALSDIKPDDTLVVFPHEICPVDGAVLEGHSTMDESFLTGEPFHISKAPGSMVISGAINGEEAITIKALRFASDSRYAKIMEVMRAAEKDRPKIRRMGDRIGAIYAPLALVVAGLAWFISGESIRFLAVLVIATPCPLLIGIPVAIIGAVSLCAQRAIIVKKPAALEAIQECETAIFDKTGTLTYGSPSLVDIWCASGFDKNQILLLVASLERYSRHPLAGAILRAGKREKLILREAARISEKPGEGLRGEVDGVNLQITGRSKLSSQIIEAAHLPASTEGLECVVLINDIPSAVLRFRDTPRVEGRSFVQHLGPKHKLHRILIVSGDRESEVRYLANRVGVNEIYAEQSPEQKLALVKKETAAAKTLFMGDGINDAPALMAATVGIAVGQHSDITSKAASVVVMDNFLERIDEFMHISARMRKIALQSAIGGMVLSVIGMLFAAFGLLTPVMGALAQEVIDVLAVLNALRAAIPPKELSDFRAQ